MCGTMEGMTRCITYGEEGGRERDKRDFCASQFWPVFARVFGSSSSDLENTPQGKADMMGTNNNKRAEKRQERQKENIYDTKSGDVCAVDTFTYLCCSTPKSCLAKASRFNPLTCRPKRELQRPAPDERGLIEDGEGAKQVVKYGQTSGP